MSVIEFKPPKRALATLQPGYDDPRLDATGFLYAIARDPDVEPEDRRRATEVLLGLGLPAPGPPIGAA